MAVSQPVEIPKSAVPATLYKYLPPERIDVLENLEIRFSSPAEFNDTFDSHYRVPKSQGTKGIVATTRRIIPASLWASTPTLPSSARVTAPYKK